MELWEIVKTLIFPVVIAALVALVPRFVKTPGERRKDVRDELADVWERLDQRDAEVDKLQQKIRDRDKHSDERDEQLRILKQENKQRDERIAELEDYKAKYANEVMKNEDLTRQLRGYEELKTEVRHLNERIIELEANGSSK